jgi:hypothetical protein
MCDWATNYGGWIIDDLTIGGTELDEDAFFYPPPPETDFMVSLIMVEEDDGEVEFIKPKNVKLKDLTEIGKKGLELDDDGYVYVLVSNNEGPADYMFSVVEDDD